MKHGDTITPRPYATTRHLSIIPAPPILTPAEVADIMEASKARQRALAGMDDDHEGRGAAFWAVVAVLLVVVVVAGALLL